MIFYVLKVAALVTATGTLAWVAVWLARVIIPLWYAKNMDMHADDLTTTELAVVIDEMEETISIIRHNCNELEMTIAASPVAALVAVPFYKLGKYTMEACERQARVARDELMKRMREQAAQETADG